MMLQSSFRKGSITSTVVVNSFVNLFFFFCYLRDKEWVCWPDKCIQFWEGEVKELFGGLSLINLGGHFEGAQVLHWKDEGDSRELLFSGDVLQVCFNFSQIVVFQKVQFYFNSFFFPYL